MKIIASKVISNTASINIYEIDYHFVSVGINDNKPKKHKLYYNNKNQPYFNFRGHREYFFEYSLI